MVGPFWLINIVVSVLEAIIAAILVFIYLRPALRVRSKTAMLLLGLSLTLLGHALTSCASSLKLMAQGEGPNVAIPLIPMNVLALLFAILLLYLSAR